MPKYLRLIGLIIICELVGILGTVFTFSAIPTWYMGLNKPFFSPPNYLFGPVWIALYVLMGISIFRILEIKNKRSLQSNGKNNDVTNAINLFWIQLLYNAIWTPIFFGSKQLLVAFVVILAMWIYIFRTIKAFAKIDKVASYLLYPYLVWVSFATVLNYSLWMLNK